MLGCWGVVVAASLVSLWAFETKPGKTQDMLHRWPSTSEIASCQPERTLLMFIHPRCPCSDASVVELENVLRQTNASATVVAWLPEAPTEEWTEAELVRRAAELDGVTIHYDYGGKEAKRFGIKTSGHCLVFDESGSLVFSGGITGSRGHVGDNVGSKMIKQHLESTSIHQTFPVYGCPLEKL